MSRYYTITRVDEPEFGCEGPLDGEPVNGTLWLTSDDGEEIIEKMDFKELCKRRLFENAVAVRSEQYGLLRKVEVSAAIFIQDGKLFAAQRGYGNQTGKWEFPGGKIEPGETAADAVKREIREEMDCSIVTGELFDTIEYDYPEFHLKMYCILCTIQQGIPRKLEHKNFTWLSKEELYSVEWLPADMDVLKKIETELL